MTRILSRRAVLRGAGTAVALPLLDAMLPRGLAAEAAKAPRRMMFIYSPNGAVMPHWTPKKEGADYDLPALIMPRGTRRPSWSPPRASRRVSTRRWPTPPCSAARRSRRPATPPCP